MTCHTQRGRRRRAAIALVLAAGFITCTVPAASQDATSFGRQRLRPNAAEVVRVWHLVALAQPANPIRQARVLAMMHAAMHDAVNGAVPKYERYASSITDRRANAAAAAAAAAHRVLTALFPANAAALDAALADSLADIRDGDAEDAGVSLGAAVGQFIVNIRSNDGMDVPDPFTPVSGPGVWEPTPPAFIPAVEPQMQNVTPFTIRSRDQFGIDPPPDLSSDEYARDFNEVKAVGQDVSAVRDADQTHYAHFWFESSPVTWSRIAAIYTARRHASLHDTARLFALLNMAMADGFIAGFYWKRTYAFWRPVTAIRKADTDGNPETIADAAWNPFRPTPASADYPSTHSVLGAAAARILQNVTGSDRFTFCLTTSTALPAGSERCYRGFSEAALENADSRVLVGIHFRFATRAGLKLGSRIGRFAARHSLEPLD